MKRASFLTFACFLVLFAQPFGLSVAQESGQPRLAPGSLITIPPEVDFESVYNRADLGELLKAWPEVDPAIADDIRFNREIWTRDIRFQRDIWCLQFSFKPVRIVYVDIPNKEGTFDKKAVWYLVYNVKNVGPAEIGSMTGDKGEELVLNNSGGAIGSEVARVIETPITHDTTTEKCTCDFCQGEGTSVTHTRDAPLVLHNMPGEFKPRQAEKDEPIQFVPQFVFAIDRLVLGTSSANDPETGKQVSETETVAISYVDQVIPIALPAIMKREGMESIPRTTVSITREELKAGEDVWGVAMWTDIDPRVHRFSIYVSGLTNAYRWRDTIEDAARIRDRKTLKINWWRLGDRYTLSDKEIQYGFPGWRRDEMVERLTRLHVSIKDIAEKQVRPFVAEREKIEKQLADDKITEEDAKKKMTRILSKEEITEILDRCTDQEIQFLLFQGELDYEWVFR